MVFSVVGAMGAAVGISGCSGAHILETREVCRWGAFGEGERGMKSEKVEKNGDKNGME